MEKAKTKKKRVSGSAGQLHHLLLISLSLLPRFYSFLSVFNRSSSSSINFSCRAVRCVTVCVCVCVSATFNRLVTGLNSQLTRASRSFKNPCVDPEALPDRPITVIKESPGATGQHPRAIPSILQSPRHPQIQQQQQQQQQQQYGK